MDVGSKVRVNAPGHYHHGYEGEIVEVAEGETPHFETNPEGKRPSEILAIYYKHRSKVKKAQPHHHLSYGNIGDKFATIAFPDGSVAVYHFGQLGE